MQPRPQGDKAHAVGWYVVNPLNIGAQGSTGDRRTVVANSEDGAAHGRPRWAQAPVEKVREIAPPVGPDGAVYIAWRKRDDPANAPHPIVVAKSTDEAATWIRTPIVDATAAPGPAAIAERPKASLANLSVAASQLAYPGNSERIGAAFTSKLVVHKDDVAGAWAGAVLARRRRSPWPSRTPGW